MGPWSSPASRTSRFRRSPGCRVKSGSPTSASVYGLWPASAVGPAGSPHAASAMEIAAAVARRNMTAPGERGCLEIVNEPPSPDHRSDAGPLRAVVAGWYRGGMSLRGQALQEFDLPAAPQRIDELPSSAPETDALRVHAPAGPERDALDAVARAVLPQLPSGAGHGGLTPQRALFIGERCSAVLPSGFAGSGALVLDLAETAVGWVAGAQRPPAALRALTSGYQALRRLLPEEKDAFFLALRYAAVREGARRLSTGRSGALDALRAVEAVGEPG